MGKQGNLTKILHKLAKTEAIFKITKLVIQYPIIPKNNELIKIP